MLLVDTGVFVSAADRSERWHSACSALLHEHHDLIVAAPVIPETAWMLENRLGPGAEERFVSLVTSDRIEIVDLTSADYQRVLVLIRRYADLGLGFVDASIVAVAERMKIDTVTTLNRRDFAVVQPDHIESFELVP